MKDLGLIAPGNWMLNQNGEPEQLDWSQAEPTRLDAGIYTPLPLTPDLLRRLGFSLSGRWKPMEFWTFSNWLKISFENGAYYNTHIEGFGSYNSHYLHQLQNLYHILSGEELPVTAEMLKGGEAKEEKPEPPKQPEQPKRKGFGISMSCPHCAHSPYMRDPETGVCLNCGRRFMDD